MRTATPAILPITPPTTTGVGGGPLSDVSLDVDCPVISGVNPFATPVPPAPRPPSVGAAKRRDVDIEDVVSEEDKRVCDLDMVELEDVDNRDEFEYVCVAFKILKTRANVNGCLTNSGDTVDLLEVELKEGVKEGNVVICEGADVVNVVGSKADVVMFAEPSGMGVSNSDGVATGGGGGMIASEGRGSEVGG